MGLGKKDDPMILSMTDSIYEYINKNRKIYIIGQISGFFSGFDPSNFQEHPRLMQHSSPDLGSKHFMIPRVDPQQLGMSSCHLF